MYEPKEVAVATEGWPFIKVTSKDAVKPDEWKNTLEHVLREAWKRSVHSDATDLGLHAWIEMHGDHALRAAEAG